MTATSPTEEPSREYTELTPLKVVATLPDSLLADPTQAVVARDDTAVTGSLWMRAADSSAALTPVFAQLRDSVLTLFRDEASAAAAASDDDSSTRLSATRLADVSALQPVPELQFSLQLTTPSLSMQLVADSEEELKRWLDALTHSGVPFTAVDRIFKWMLHLNEVELKRATDVRMVVAPCDSVGEVVERIFNCFQTALDAVPLREFSPEAFALRVEDPRDAGWSELLLDRARPLDSCARVREAAAARRTLSLYVVPLE